MAQVLKKWETNNGVSSGKAGYYAAVKHEDRDEHKNVGGLGYGDSPSYDAIYTRHGVNPETHKILAWPKHTNPQGGKQWYDKLEVAQPSPSAKRGTSTGYMTGGATEKKKVPKEYRGNTNSEGGIPFGKKPQ
jgi:hypothetical protein